MLTIDIRSMDGDYKKFAYNLDFTKENSKSIYAEGMYGDEYRIEKDSKRVFKNSKQIASTCEYSVF